MKEQNIIRIKGVSKKYKRFVALDNIDLTITNGMFGLLGHNGAGKTTLMKLLTTLSEPTNGTITINGYDVIMNKHKIRSIVGFLPQQFSTYPQLTAYEFLDYISKLNNIRDKNIRNDIIIDLLNKVNLLDVKDKKTGEFSGGMKRRLGIAQALIKNPNILIVDEPTAGLDPGERIRFRTMLVELSQDKIVILSTHIVEDISASCEHIGVLEKGKLLFSGKPINFINDAENKIWEIYIKNKKELAKIQKNYNIISIKQVSDAIKVRVLTDEPKETYISQKVTPNLEDALLAFTYRGDKI